MAEEGELRWPEGRELNGWSTSKCGDCLMGPIPYEKGEKEPDPDINNCPCCGLAHIAQELGMYEDGSLPCKSYGGCVAGSFFGGLVACVGLPCCYVYVVKIKSRALEKMPDIEKKSFCEEFFTVWCTGGLTVDQLRREMVLRDFDSKYTYVYPKAQAAPVVQEANREA